MGIDSYLYSGVLTCAAKKCRVSEDWIDHQFSRLVIRIDVKGKLPFIAECVFSCDQFSGAILLLIDDRLVHSYFAPSGFHDKVSIGKLNLIGAFETKFDL